MYCRWVLTFVLSIIFAVQTQAETFTVISNADSGPGTLREALTKAAANGAAEKDFIYFNLPDVSEAGRTIAVQSQLPNVTSNIIIDGTVQTGSKLLLSDAKIVITGIKLPYLNIRLAVSGLNIDQANNIEIYGLKITAFNHSNSAFNKGINLNSAQNIRIGAPGKGNWINDCDYFILGTSSAQLPSTTNSEISIESNYIGYEGTALSYSLHGIEVTSQNLTLGGATPSQGNHIMGPVACYGDQLKISNNFIDIDQYGNEDPAHLSIIECGGANNVEISYNTSRLLRFELRNITNFNVFANKDITRSVPAMSVRMFIYDCSDGVIGSEDENLRNIFFTDGSVKSNTLNSAIVNSSSKNVALLKNEFTCAKTAYQIYTNQSDGIVIPLINVLVNNNLEYSGTASPNSNIYIYYDDSDCPVCSPLRFLTKIQANNSGVWKLTGDFSGKRLVANSLLLNTSSEYTQPSFPDIGDYYVTKQPTCGQNNGSIEINSNYKHILRFEWFKADGTKISDGKILENAGPGTYYARGYNGQCYAQTTEIILFDISPVIDDSTIQIKNPSCNQSGSISGLITYYLSSNKYSYIWTKKNSGIVGNTVNIDNLAAGEYSLTMIDDVTGCETVYGPVIIKNVDAPTINTSAKVINQTACNQATGSIKGITATGTGTLTYSWRNAQDTEVGTSLNLTNQPAGVYKLKVTDESACEPVYSEPIEITSLGGVQLVTTNVSVRSSTCGLANGYIRGLQAPGASTFIWTRDDGSVAGNTLDLENIPAGNYRLTISNATCTSYADFRIDAVTPTVYPQFAATITKTCAAFPTGTISINTDGAQDQPGIFRWVDSQNNTAGFGKTIQYLPSGAYKLYLTDAGSCESFYKEYTVDAYPEFTVAFGNSHDIYCGVGKGSIDASVVSGGTGNYFYEWKDGSGTVILSKTQPFINDLDAGTYTLSITDGGCNLAMLTYTIKEQTQIIPAPIIADVEVTRTGNTTLQVTDPFPTAIYRLYDSETAITPLAESQGGSFTVNVTGNRSYYIGLSYGECESPRTRVRIVLTILNVNIPNTFTPNGDGFNDYWTITGIEESKIATVKIFSRSGQMVFQSIGYPKPFDGTQNGRQLSASTYYYIIEQKNAKPISGHVTILR